MIKENRLARLISKDKRVIRFQKIIESGVFSVDNDALILEMQNLHKMIKINRVSARDILRKFKSRVIPIILQNQAYRSRCVEIKTSCWDKYYKLEGRTEKLKKYLKNKYSKQIATKYKTQTERSQALDSMFSDMAVMLNDIDIVMDIADLIIADLDQASWHIKYLIETMNIGQKRSYEV